jgi:hypothetical protein
LFSYFCKLVHFLFYLVIVFLITVIEVINQLKSIIILFYQFWCNPPDLWNYLIFRNFTHICWCPKFYTFNIFICFLIIFFAQLHCSVGNFRF